MVSYGPSSVSATINHPARVPESPQFVLLPAQCYFTTSTEEAPPASHYLLVPHFVILGSPGVATETPTHLAELIAG